MSESVNLKRGDTGATFTDTLEKAGAAINLTGATVKFLMWIKTELDPGFSDSANIIDAANGKVSYGNPLGAAFPKALGLYDQEWEITFAGGTILTVPGKDHNDINIVKDLNPPPP